MNIRLLIPIKSLDRVKSRLSEKIEDKFRIGLSLAMLDHVIKTGIKTQKFKDILVVGGDTLISELCDNAQSSWLPQPEGIIGLNKTIDVMFEQTIMQGFEGLLYLPADLPELQTSDLQGILKLTQFGTSFVMCSDRHGKGTNALFMPKNSKFKCQLGEDSFLKHYNQIQLIREKFNIYQNHGIGFDIDNIEDFNLLLNNNPNWKSMIEEYYSKYN
jgi:2-phospho-L-lactate guanylyltransferase